MNATQYLENGLKNYLDFAPEGYKDLGKCKHGCHSLNFFIKEEDGKIVDVKFTASKRCKKLLAVADYVSSLIKEKGKIEFDNNEVLEFFKEEKEIDKLKDRLKLVKEALNI